MRKGKSCKGNLRRDKNRKKVNKERVGEGGRERERERETSAVQWKVSSNRVCNLLLLESFTKIGKILGL